MIDYTNVVTADKYVHGVKLGLASNYARVIDEPNMARVRNKTAPNEQPEYITFRCDYVDKISTPIPVKYPAPTKDGVQYSVKIDSVDRTQIGDVVYDEPCSITLTIRHANSNTWNNQKVATLFKRLMSALAKGMVTGEGEIQDADWRFEDLMRSALMPQED